jgi:nicotinamide mononucleotide transporter
MSFFDMNNIFFKALGYPMSYLEFFGVVFGFIAVVLSARGHILSWPTGIVNVMLFFFLFYQVQLYPDMFLQIFFFITNAMGWWRWANPKPGEENQQRELKISWMNPKQLILFLTLGFAGTVLMGSFAKNLHEFFPILFSKPSAFPYLDSFVTVMSIVTTFFMIQKKIECWIIWLLIDIIATYMYFKKEIKFVGFEYLVFCFVAIYGLWHWIREYKSYKHLS